jgi:hypothetical protein
MVRGSARESVTQMDSEVWSPFGQDPHHACLHLARRRSGPGNGEQDCEAPDFLARWTGSKLIRACAL